ncbi:hypothetical protein P280DRAFT_256796 [Massarina eburnea CBS 473.64]|uniref:Uncharacterized protein n=1 Tax=Massarina eburnea CBS 473.64 TaxID=1395130 RepID=A0A6A6S9M8_9PLEO|nr:hypothetical protein P280DRAFT_256796 [Massarina eburnea CBS 473.64]
MCYTESVFHQPCCHWGKDRLEPCCRSRIVDGFHTGCGYHESLGSANSSELCHDCKYRAAQGEGWKPFAPVSNEGWSRLEQQVQHQPMPANASVAKRSRHRYWSLRRWWPSRFWYRDPGHCAVDLPPVHRDIIRDGLPLQQRRASFATM